MDPQQTATTVKHEMVAMKWYIGSFESHVGISYSVPPSYISFAFDICRFQAGSSNTKKTSLKDQEAGGSKKKKTSLKDQEAGSSKKN